MQNTKMAAWILSLLMAAMALVLLNAPSIKLFYRSEIVNIGAVAGLWGIGLLRLMTIEQGHFHFGRKKLIFLSFFTLLWA